MDDPLHRQPVFTRDQRRGLESPTGLWTDECSYKTVSEAVKYGNPYGKSQNTNYPPVVG